jgi:peptidoglycan/LPS O-acetylase OafA/YrhL
VSAKPRLGELDALRGIAASGVVIYHYTKFVHEDFHVPRPALLDAPGLSWLFPFQLGSYGVALFFVISGFVIFMTLERTEHALDFLVSRLSRLYPAFWCGVLVTTAFRLSVGGEPLRPLELLANLTMFAEWLGYPFTDGVYWTLVVEMQFYALMFVLWRVGALAHIEQACLGWFALLIVDQVAPKLGANQHVADLIATALILKHIPLFAAGMMFYRIFTQGFARLRVLVIALALAATWLSGNIPKAIIVTVSFGLMALLCVGRLAPLGRSRALRWLGDRSYTLYLVHMTVGLILMGKLLPFTQSGIVLCLLPAVFSLGLADAMHRLVEKPSLAAIRAWYDGKRRLRRAAAPGS